MNTLVLALMALSLAAPPASPDAAAVEREARHIETMLIAPCCWNAQVSEHQSEASDQVKREIRALLAAGRTRQQVLDAFVAQYGKRILAEPPAGGLASLLYVGLPLVFVGSAAALVLFIRRSARHLPEPAPAPGAAGAPPDAEREKAYAARLDDELRDMD